MNQTIRVPKQGKTANSRRIAVAVDDQVWQEFRLSMKGKPTCIKISMLVNYIRHTPHATHWPKDGVENPYTDVEHCDICLRVDNYVKALVRGGQVPPGKDIYLVEVMSRRLYEGGT